MSSVTFAVNKIEGVLYLVLMLPPKKKHFSTNMLICICYVQKMLYLHPFLAKNIFKEFKLYV